MTRSIKDWLKDLVFKLYLALLPLQLREFYACRSKCLSRLRAVVYLKAKLANGALFHSDSDEGEVKKYTHMADLILGVDGVDTIEYSNSFGDIRALITKVEDEDRPFLDETKIDYQQTKEACDKVDKYLEDVKNNSEFFNVKIFNEKVRAALIKCKQTNKKYDKHIKAVRDKLQEARREPHKYDISEFSNWLDFTKIAALFSAVIYVGGYTYTWALFNQFEFRFSGFFTIFDYFSAPLDKIIYLLIFFVVMYVFLLFKRVDMASDSKYIAELRESQNRKYFDPLFFLAVIYFLGIGLFHWNIVELSIGLFMALTFYGLPFAVDRYFKPSKSLNKVLILAICLLCYLVLILFGAHIEHNQITNSKENNEIVIYLDNGEVISKQIFVMKNSEYFFYYNNSEKNINVIPRSRVYRVVGPIIPDK